MTTRKKKESLTLEQLAEKKARAGEIVLHKPIRDMTRRDFLASGVLSFSASLAAPTLLGTLFSRNLFAASCLPPSAQAVGSLPAVIHINLQGGGILSANYVPRDQNGALLSSYGKMGLGSQTNLMADTALFRKATVPDPIAGNPNNTKDVAFLGQEFGIGAAFGDPDPSDLSKVFFVNTNNNNDVGFLRGLRSNPTNANQQTTPDNRPAFLSKTAFAAICVQSRDDSSANFFDISGLVCRTGISGQYLGNLSTTSFGQQPALIQPPPPVPISRIEDILAAVKPSGALAKLTRAQVGSIFKLVKNLSDSQAAEFNALGLQNSGKVMEQIGVATQKNLDLQTDPQDPTQKVDPRLDPAITAIWGIANGAGSQTALVQAGLVYTALMGYSRTARINLGGYDYHNNTRTTGDTKDQQAGTLVNKILATADALGKPVFIYVTSDGSVESADSTTVGTAWRSDRGDAGMAFMFAYDPAGRPVTNNRAPGFGLAHQVGWFTNEQAAVRTGFVAGWNDEKAAAAAFANYLKFANRWDLYSPVMCQFAQGTTADYFSTTDLDRILKFGAA